MIGFLLVLVWPTEIYSCQKGSSAPPEVSINGLTGNSLPPKDSAFYAEFQNCGLVNDCKKNGFACLNRGKRSILRKPWQRNGSRHFQEGEDYVKGGTSQGDFRYPWVGRMVYKEDAWWKLWFVKGNSCTASLISSRHVITARHCLKQADGLHLGYGTKQKLTTKEFRVVFGSTTNKKAAISYFVKEIYIPPRLPIPQRPHDLAVLRINEVVLSEKLRPICLPIYGLPYGVPKQKANLVSVDFVGYGHAGYSQAGSLTGGAVTYTYPHLQLLQNLNLDSNQRKLRIRKRDENSIWIKFNAGDVGQLCNGDSGGPLMWKNPANGRHIILGTLEGTIGRKKKCIQNNKVESHYASFTRVDDLLPSIIDYMKGGKNNLCMNIECQRGATKTYKRTWLAKIKGYPGQTDAYETLNSPCFYQEGIDLEEKDSATIGRPRYVCPVGSHRTIERQYGHHDERLMALGGTEDFTAFRTCEPCGKDENGNDLPQDWDSSHFLDEITSGSMSQPRYKGIDQPTIDLDNFPDRENHVGYADVCDMKVNGENEILTCPEISPTGIVHKCLLAENICDGISDCHDEWDESPHICTGKCDYFHQYQYSNKTYVIPDGASSFNVSSAKACHKKCVDYSSSCTHFSWLDNESGTCTLLTGGLPTDVHAITEPTKPNSLFAVRGPAMCGRRDEQDDYFNCNPTVGAPYRSGIYFIQSKSGHFLKRDPGKTEVFLASSTYSHIASKSFNYAWKDNGFKNLNGGEWIFEFYGATSMDNSYFAIRSGVEGGHHQTQYLTAYPRHVNVTSKIVGNYGDFGAGLITVNQRWYIEQSSPKQGNLEVKIWTKLLNKKWYLRPSPLVLGTINNQASVTIISASVTIGQDDASNTSKKQHIFRIFDCDHGLDDGNEFRGIKRNSHDKPKYNIKSMLLATTVGLVVQTQRSIEEGVLRQVFGITHTRFEAAKMDYDAFDNLLNTINLALRDSESLLDYAGRMRIPNSGYEKLRASWINIVSKGTLSLCSTITCHARPEYKHGNEFIEMCKKLVQMNFIH